MKLVHTSDWHLGSSLYGVPRAADHDAVLAEILEHARTAAPDLILHTGDLFDAARPAYDDLHRAMDALEALALVAPVVVLCGNHDSPQLFALLDKLVARRSENGDLGRRLRFVIHARRPDDGGILQFSTARGHRIRLAPLPFIHANRMVDAFEDADRWTSAYADRIRTIVGALGRGLTEGADLTRDVLVFAAHLHISGASLAGSERVVHVADDYAGKLEQLPAVTYAAFGHIHKPQKLPTTAVVGAYAGSPIQLDFGEIGEDKSTVVVEAEPGRPARVERIPLTRGRRLREFAGTLAELEARAEEFGDDLCKLVIHTETPTPELSRRVRDLIPRATPVQIAERCAARAALALDERGDGDAGDARDADAAFGAMFRDYLAGRETRKAASGDVVAKFNTLLAAIEAEEEPDFAEERAFAGDPIDSAEPVVAAAEAGG